MPECRTCGAEIVWANHVPTPGNQRPRPMPIDAHSHDDPSGNLGVRRVGTALRYRVLKKGEEPEPGEHRAVSHFATCKDAQAHRKGKPSW